MRGLRQFFGRKSLRRRGAVLLVLTCWAVQGVFYLSLSEKQRASASSERERDRESSRFRLGDLSVTELQAFRERVRAANEHSGELESSTEPALEAYTKSVERSWDARHNARNSGNRSRSRSEETTE